MNESDLIILLPFFFISAHVRTLYNEPLYCKKLKSTVYQCDTQTLKVPKYNNTVKMV